MTIRKTSPSAIVRRIQTTVARCFPVCAALTKRHGQTAADQHGGVEGPEHDVEFAASLCPRNRIPDAYSM